MNNESTMFCKDEFKYTLKWKIPKEHWFKYFSESDKWWKSNVYKRLQINISK